MLIRYCGSRPSVSITCTGRTLLYFGPENNHTVDVNDSAIASDLLASPLHSFKVIIPAHTEVSPAPAAHIEVKAAPAKELEIEEPKKKKKEKKNG